jgi:hypothetical protein
MFPLPLHKVPLQLVEHRAIECQTNLDENEET